MRTDPRAIDCRNCYHDNDSHDPLVGCMMPYCSCPVRFPAAEFGDAAEQAKRAAETARQILRPIDPKPAKRRARWSAIQAFLSSASGARLAALILAASFLFALIVFAVKGTE